MKLRSLCTLLPILLLALTTVFVVRYLRPNPPAINLDPCKNCNVLLISVDTLRADHLGLYGYSLNTTPRLDEFFKDALIFTNVFTSSPQTTPSFAELFSGLEPLFSGVHTVGQKIPADLQLLQTEFKKNGFTTAAVVSNDVLIGRISGLQKDFDFYEDIFTERDSVRPQILERTAKDATQKSLDWLEQRPKEKPFYLWTHYMDPHGSYNPPLEFKQRFARSEKSTRWIKESKISKYLRIKDIARMDDRISLDEFIQAYDGEIAYVDNEIGKLLDYLQSNHLLENTIIIFHSDHGENLGEKELFGHGADVLDETTRVALMIRFPPRMSVAGYIFRNLISIGDLFPTILDFVGINNYPQSNGISLLPLFQTGKHERKQVFLERFKDGRYPASGIREANRKVIRYEGKSSLRFACFDFNGDELEKKSRPCEASYEQGMIDQLNERLGQHGSKITPEITQDPKDIERLRTLGYIN